MDLREQAKATGRLKYWTMVYYEITKLEAEAGEEPCRELQAAYDRLQELRARKDRSFWGMITIRPKDGLDMDEFFGYIHKILNKKWLNDNYLMVMEQKGASVMEMGKGMHSHILFKLNGVKHGRKQKSFKQCLNEVLGTVKTFNNELFTEQSVDLVTCKQNDGEKMQNYLLGEKSSEEKQEIQKIDKLWREKLNIMRYYGKKMT